MSDKIKCTLLGLFIGICVAVGMISYERTESYKKTLVEQEKQFKKEEENLKVVSNLKLSYEKQINKLKQEIKEVSKNKTKITNIVKNKDGSMTINKQESSQESQKSESLALQSEKSDVKQDVSVVVDKNVKKDESTVKSKEEQIDHKIEEKRGSNAIWIIIGVLVLVLTNGTVHL